MVKKKRRSRTAHPGVKIIKRTRPGRKTVWVARWKDPITSQHSEISLNARGLTTAEARREWAIKKSRQLRTVQAEYETGTVPQESPWSVADALHDYLHRAKERLDPITVDGYSRSLQLLLEWSDKNGVGFLPDLTEPKLAAFKDWLARKQKFVVNKGGKRGERVKAKGRRSITTINHDLGRTRIFLHEARRLGRVPRLDRDDITETLSGLRGPRPRPQFLRPNELRELLAASLRHDREKYKMTRKEKSGELPNGSTNRYEPIAPFVLFVLLSGCRLKEARSVLWKQVYLKGEAPEIVILASAAKTRMERSIDLSVCPSLVRLLSAMKIQAGENRYVFGGQNPFSKNLAKSSRKRIIKHLNGPEFTWQRLRQTCDTYLVNAPGIYGGASIFLAAKRLGHSVVVAEQRYAGLFRDIAKEAKTLEEAMRIEDLAMKIVGEVTGLEGSKEKRSVGAF